MGGSYALIIGVLAAGQLDYEVSLRTEGRTGTSSTSADSLANFVQLDPAAALSTRLRAFDITGAYRPRLLFALAVHQLAVLHRGTLGTKWRLSRKTRLTFDQSLAYGRNDFSPLIGVQGTSPPDPRLPPVLILKYLQSASTIGVTHSTLTGVEWGGSASYSLSGGADQAARNVLPLSRNGALSGHVDFELTRTDVLSATAVGSLTTFSNHARTLVVSGGSGWRHQFSPATQGDVSAGLSITQSVRPGLPDVIKTGPFASLGVSHRASIRRQQLLGSARVSYTKAVDPYGGGAYSRVDGILGAEYSPIRSLSFTLRAAGSRALSGPPELRNGLAQVELASLFAIDRHLSVSAGARTAWYSGTARSALQGFLWAAFLGLTVGQQGRL